MHPHSPISFLVLEQKPSSKTARAAAILTPNTPQFNTPTRRAINPSEQRTSATGWNEAKCLNKSTATSRLRTEGAETQKFFKHSIPPSFTTESFKLSSSETKLRKHPIAFS
ncbi:hypothetical protein PanWU01x14_028260 [Parasponia andersonii]|uniref:Uncharacterized protein n=1 Tax=Parasponia andersonii TaxID=3476 RepID=A0A2P5DV99_PARAD|nr:hypothetical protein PanWU01x14_028260 [Parasponia andersonii]